LWNVRKVGRSDASRTSVYTGSPVSGEPHTTRMGLSVVAAAATRSVARAADRLERPGDGADDHVDVRVGDDRVEDLAAALVGGRGPPLSTGFETRRCGGIHWCSAFCVFAVSGGMVRPSAASRSAMCAGAPEIA
jgi:hypothetical protein